MGAHLGDAVHVTTLRAGAQLLRVGSCLFRSHDLRGFAEYLFLAVSGFTQGDLLLSHAGIVLRYFMLQQHVDRTKISMLQQYVKQICEKIYSAMPK
jgi:hypothetical protein